MGLQHVLGKVDATVARGFLTHQRAAPEQTLAGQNAFITTGQTLVLAEHVTDLACTHADITRRYVSGRTDVAVEFVHEGLTETHDLLIGAALGVEVGAALATADFQASEGVFEDLFEAEEFDDAGVYGRMKAKAALVRAES